MSMRISTMKNLRSKGEEWKDYMPCVFAIAFVVLLGVVGIYGASKPGSTEEQVFSKGNYAPVFSRKLLAFNSTSDDDYYDEGGPSPDRIGEGDVDRCSKDNILLFQNQTAPLPSGIPTYTVDIENVCLSDTCNIGGIHVSCGWFSTARLINPNIFRRLNYDDCLVNGGNPIGPGEVVTFAYANTYAYPMSVKSVSC